MKRGLEYLFFYEFSRKAGWLLAICDHPRLGLALVVTALLYMLLNGSMSRRHSLQTPATENPAILPPVVSGQPA